MKFLFAALILLSVCPLARAEDERDALNTDLIVPAPAKPPVLPPEAPLWYHNAGEYLASRTTRTIAPTDVSTKIISDAKRFDVSVGKRIPLYNWGTEGLSQTWSVGVDGGMLASLIRYTNQGRLTFATNTFDGYFGAWAGYLDKGGWMAIFRMGHLSAHLVDNSPLFLTPIAYSQFWNEVIVGKTFPALDKESDWDLHVQGSVGINNTSVPSTSQPRATLDADFGYALSGADTMALIATADVLRAGIENQNLTYSFFLGTGYLARPQTHHRPVRFGLAYFRGSDYRNQLYQNRQNWLTFELAAGF